MTKTSLIIVAASALAFSAAAAAASTPVAHAARGTAPALSSPAGHDSGPAPAAPEKQKQAGYRDWTQAQMKSLQQALIGKGYDIKATGMWGSDTREAVAKFQNKNGLNVTGFPNQATRDALGLDW